MSTFATALSHLGSEESLVLLKRLSGAYEKQARKLDAAAAHAERNGAYGMAQDLYKNATILDQAGEPLFNLHYGNTPDRDMIVATVLESRKQAKEALKLAQLVEAPKGRAPKGLYNRLQLLRENMFAPKGALQDLRRKLEIDPKKQGESLNTWIGKIEGAIRNFFDLSYDLQMGRLSAPEARSKAHAILKDPEFRTAIARGKLMTKA